MVYIFFSHEFPCFNQINILFNLLVLFKVKEKTICYKLINNLKTISFYLRLFYLKFNFY